MSSVLTPGNEGGCDFNGDASWPADRPAAKGLQVDDTFFLVGYVSAVAICLK